MFLKKGIGQQIADLVNDVLDNEWHHNIQSANRESLGVENGKELIMEYLNYREYGCALEHFEYIISELDLSLTLVQKGKVKDLKQLIS